MPQVKDINRRVLEVLSETEMVQLDAFIVRLHLSASLLRHDLEGALPKAQRRPGVHENGHQSGARTLDSHGLKKRSNPPWLNAATLVPHQKKSI